MWGHILALTSLGFGFGSQAVAESADFVDTFKAIDQAWHVADYEFSHPMFDTDWRTSQITVDKGLHLTLEPQKGQKNRFVGGSIRREEVSHFGRYEITMKAAKGAGLVTGFFTYTGPHYGTQHDEIDIEFLGKDTTQMHVAWFVDGKLRNKFIDLGFDASEKLRDYAFEWHPDRLRWFAEDQLIFEHHAKDGPIPLTPSRLFINLWAADHSIAGWAGRTKRGQEGIASVEGVRFEAFRDAVSVPEQDLALSN